MYVTQSIGKDDINHVAKTNESDKLAPCDVRPCHIVPCTIQWDESISKEDV